MFVTKIDITNYKIFKNLFSIDFNVPENSKKGSGLTVLCGENGIGKTSILESLSLAFQDYKSDNFSIENINDLSKNTEIQATTTSFQVKTVLPKGTSFEANGFVFKAHKRKRENSILYGSLVVNSRSLHSETEKHSYELKCDSPTTWGQSRYEQPIFLFLDKNRIYQTRKGNTLSSNFDFIMENLSSKPQTVEGETAEYNLPEKHPLNKAFEDFQKAFGISLKLYKNNPSNQMENAFIASNTSDNIIKLSNLGSGYEMFFSILWAIYRSLAEKKDLIILLDEPELHLHPSMQKRLIKLIIEYSDKVQFIIATHSPLFIKQLHGVNPSFHILIKGKEEIIRKDIQEQKIKSFLSLNEVNFMAFGLYTEEYFNELYETLYRQSQEKNETIKSYNFDEKFFINQKSLPAIKPHKSNDSSKKVSYITFIRNIIHHRVDYEKNNLNYTDEELKSAIDTMRSYL